MAATTVGAQRTVVMATLAAGTVIIGARLRTGAPPTQALKAATGVFAASLLLSVAAEEVPEVAQGFAFLVLATAVLADGPRLLGKAVANTTAGPKAVPATPADIARLQADPVGGGDFR